MLDPERDKHSHDRWIRSVCDHLNKLIQFDVDAACTYREALTHVDDLVVRVDLEAFLRDHERHVMELSRVVREIGEPLNLQPVDAHRDFKGALLEGMTKLRSRGTLGALRAMRMNEKLTNRAYDKAADLYMPPLGQVIVMENLNDERRHLAAIEAHIDRIAGRHITDVNQLDQQASENLVTGKGVRDDRPFPVMDRRR